MAKTLSNRQIFISYRRQDAPGEAGRLCDDLQRVFGEQSVFMDVEGGISAGADFRHAITQSVAECPVFLAVIGPDWGTVTDSQGNRRLEKADDWVRLEIASGLAQNKRVIPVLVHDAAMPDARTLPPDIRDLAYREGVELTNTRWGTDLQGFVESLRRHLPVTDDEGRGKPRRRLGALAVVGVLVLALALLFQFYRRPVDHTEVRAALQTWTNALATNNPERISDCYAYEVDEYLGMPNTTKDGIESRLIKFLKDKKNYVVSASFSDEVFEQQTRDAAVVHFKKNVVSAGSPGKVVSTGLRFTYTKTDGSWKITKETLYP